MKTFLHVLTLIPCLFVLTPVIGEQLIGEDEPISFNRHIRPILASNCFSCHGPDEGSRKADLRLDSFEEATRDLDGLFAIKPGDPHASTLLERVRSQDPDEVMPPPETGHAVTPKQATILEKWINQGAGYEKHWSFTPVTKPTVPEVSDPDWPRNGLDFFVLKAMQKQGLSPNPEADRYSLVRRIYLDLTGLPPSWEEAVSFVNNPHPQAYEQLVDKLLDDPAYGEKWAAMWLDLARYADSAGYGSDPLRVIWKYRDWVIDAWNRNLPYDQFTIEQIAGDLLPDPDENQLLATAFHRNTKTNTEGGTDDEEFRTEAIRDRVDTTMQVWMGLTMGCAKCHTHKYDPISITEYYQFYDFFNQTEDSDRGDEHPRIATPTTDQKKKLDQLDLKIKTLSRLTSNIEGEASERYNNWKSDILSQVDGKSIDSTLTLGSWSSVGPFKGKDFDEAHKKDFVAIKNPLDLKAEYEVEKSEDEKIKLKWTQKPEWKDGEIVTFSGDNSAIYLYREIVAELDTHQYISVGSDDSIQIWINGKRVHENKVQRGVEKGQDIVGLPLNKGKNQLVIKVVNGGGGYGFVFEPKKANAPDSIIALLKKADADSSPEDNDSLKNEFLKTDARTRQLKADLAQAQSERRSVNNQVVLTPVMRELSQDKRRQSHVLVKGNFLTRGDKVSASVPEAFHPFTDEAPLNRMGVAKWLVDPANPLTSRVAVNRFWSRLFGKGIVETEEDFGTQGKLPSHPLLLDWLAFTFQHDLEWDTKKFLKLLVTSATYRQSSLVIPDKYELDPNNIYLARMSRNRLDAELVRDQALSVSGLLSQILRGPSVYPPQPDGLWRAAFNGQRNWATSENEDRFRRGIYTFLRRSIPYPSMATFDAPSRETCTVRRIPTNTPLQAFVTMNDIAFVEMAQGFAVRINQKAHISPEEKIRYAIQTALIRPADQRQVEVLLELYHSELNHFKKNAEEAAELAGRFKSSFPESISVEEAAAWVVVANVILNLDGFLMKG